ncbi:type II toxin-antitoxin system VapC family toxin [Polaromonas naphthalenivorans]|uniref:Ribonuclease VapC n=1 Tax=Polaromonas naphthalenivorans (strain CJ2) TaxID=365044 RepID=A1VQC7_POLNA|nr:type II toxin-antitoxin system VapC family toxin [Polaromonas naphthalenivorans]ABM37855.1 PilT protein domain protein [Polaromonas naphthalenivorans CJ2]
MSTAAKTAPSAAAGIFLLDTNIISDLMKGEPSLAARRGREAVAQGRVASVCTSVIVQCELMFGLLKRPSLRLQAAYDLEIARLQVEPLTEAVPPIYARLRAQLEAKGTPIGPNDALIAAHAMALNATLVSADAEFLRVPGLRVENWLAEEST